MSFESPNPALAAKLNVKKSPEFDKAEVEEDFHWFPYLNDSLRTIRGTNRELEIKLGWRDPEDVDDELPYGNSYQDLETLLIPFKSKVERLQKWVRKM